MIDAKLAHTYYQAILAKNTEYDGLFFVGVKSTGIFCTPSCPARKPKPENCEFFKTAQEALLASYRPCKRCRPLSHPNQMPKVIQTLIDLIEAHPEKRWADQDFRNVGLDASTARRQFKKRFGMTFVAYARARRMGQAMKEIRSGKAIIEAQLTGGYESGSGFRDAFTKITGHAPSLLQTEETLKASWLDSPLGPMLAISDEKELYLLEFADRRGLEREIEYLRKRTKMPILPGNAPPLESIKQELALYFKGRLQTFKTPLHRIGSPFQLKVWNALQHIPYGTTCSYRELAATIGLPTAYRAVANANGCNQFAIIVPCHRVINTNGALGGYSGGINRKEWLLTLEEKIKYEKPLIR